MKQANTPITPITPITAMKTLLLAITITTSLLSVGLAQSPHLGKLTIDTQVPLIMDGKPIGSITLKASAEIPIAQFPPDKQEPSPTPSLVTKVTAPAPASHKDSTNKDSTNTFEISKESSMPIIAFLAVLVVVVAMSIAGSRF